MTNVPLGNVVAEAHRALENGDYMIARAACQHILAHYPAFADTHRLHGEILLEQGETDGARQAFEGALAYDPQNVLATLGLGVIAEESLDLAGAASFFQQALEMDPSLTQLRDELVRLYSKVYGQGGRLHVSGIGLAAIHARGNQLTLAERQYQTVVEQLPGRIDVLLALAEVKWRAGDLAGTQALCQEVLATRPRTVRALYLQGDLYRRRGATDKARECFLGAAAIDPVGDVARALEQANPSCALVEFAPVAEVPAFDPASVPVMAEPTTNSSLGVTTPTIEENEWQRLTTELTGTAGAATVSKPPPAESDGFTWPWEAETNGQSPEPAPAKAAEPVITTTASTNASLDELMAGWDRAAEEMATATPSNRPVHGYSDTLSEINALGFKPFDVDATGPADDAVIAMAAMEAAEPPAEPAASPAMPAAIGDAEAALQALVGDWDAIDEELRRATPTGPSAEGAALAAQLGIADVKPFAPEGVDGAGSPGTGWTDFDRTLAAATPPPAPPRGFTSELNTLDAEGHTPFSFADLDSGIDSLLDAAPSTPPLAPAATSQPTHPDRVRADIEPESVAVTPPPALPRGFSTELNTLSAEGHTPFSFADLDPGIPAGLDAVLDAAPRVPLPPPPPAVLPAVPPTPASVAVTPQPTDLDRAWANIESELAAAATQTANLPAGFTAELNELDTEGLLPFRSDELAADGSIRAWVAPAADAWDTIVANETLEVAANDRLTNDQIAPSPTDEALPTPWIVTPEADVVVADDWSAPEASDWMTDPDTHSAVSVDEPVVEVIAAVRTMTPQLPTVEMRGRRAAQPAASYASEESLEALPPVRPTYGGTIALSGSIFDQLRGRKEELLASGWLQIRRSEAPAAVAPLLDLGVGRAESISDAEPTDPVARRRLADAYAASGQPTDAALQYRLLLRMDPAMASVLAGPIEDLAAAYSSAPPVMRLLGELYMRQGRFNQALAVYRSLLLAGAAA